jgi:hypothetical protein
MINDRIQSSATFAATSLLQKLTSFRLWVKFEEENASGHHRTLPNADSCQGDAPNSEDSATVRKGVGRLYERLSPIAT